MGFNKKFGEKKENLERCRHCSGERIEFTKHIGYGKSLGVVYHYKAYCLDCGKTYYVKRCRKVYEKVAKKDWIKSKSFKIQFE